MAKESKAGIVQYDECDIDKLRAKFDALMQAFNDYGFSDNEAYCMVGEWIIPYYIELKD